MIMKTNLSQNPALLTLTQLIHPSHLFLSLSLSSLSPSRPSPAPIHPTNPTLFTPPPPNPSSSFGSSYADLNELSAIRGTCEPREEG